MKIPRHLSFLGNLNGRSGISDAASMNLVLLSDLVDKISVAHPRSSLVYHHGMPSKHVPEWTRGRHSIGYWVCESTEANPEYKESMDAHTQIWTASEASAAALRAIGSKTPVFVVPHAVELPDYHVNRAGRDTVTTLFAFSPPMERKNPEALIRAWREAFDGDKSARLVVKTRQAPASLKRLLQVVAGDDARIEVINDDLPWDAMAALYDRADIWCSMQRAGAFELHVAQAAAHGLPIITTDVGGPKDYLSTGAAVFVPVTPITPLQDCELNKTGVWFEPDHAATVNALRSLAANDTLRRSLGAAARDCVRNRLSPDVVRAAMMTALQALPEALPEPRKSVMLLPTHLEAARPGLDVVGDNTRSPGPHVPVVASHRRSGTHLVGSMIMQGWQQTTWLKSHAFPDGYPAGNRAVYVVRNPVDCLWSCWRWWSSNMGNMDGGAMNRDIAAALAGYSFEDYLEGRVGRTFGFQSMPDGDIRRDCLAVGRGMFYDPIAYWLDHWSEAMATDSPLIVYEDLLGPSVPDNVVQTLSSVMGRPPVEPLRRIVEPVGLNASTDHRPGKGLAHWPNKPLARLKKMLTPVVLEAAGRRSLDHWIA